MQSWPCAGLERGAHFPTWTQKRPFPHAEHPSGQQHHRPAFHCLVAWLSSLQDVSWMGLFTGIDSTPFSFVPERHNLSIQTRHDIDFWI